MKIVTKLIVSVTSTVLLIILVCLVYISFRARALVTSDIEDRTLTLIKTFDANLFVGYDKEGPDGTNAPFQQSLLSMKTSMPDIQEMNIYKISLGKEVASTDPSTIGTPVDPEDVAAAKENRTVVLFHRSGGANVIDVTGPLHYQGGQPYVMGIKTDVRADLGTFDRLVLQTAGIGLLLLIAAAGLILLLSRNIAGPIRLAAAGFRDLAMGDADLTRRIDSHASDEIGALSRDFNTFVSKLHVVVSNLKEAQAEIAGVTARLGTSAKATAQSVAEISRSLVSVGSTAQTQSESAVASSSAIEQIAKNIESLERVIGEQAASVNEASASIEEMVGNIDSVFRSIERMVEQFASVSDAVQGGQVAQESASRLAGQIEQRSSSLRTANEAVAEIASRTNLLAMNAAIEAAHAGEAGRGFAIVADEIRKLAESSANQSRAIGADIAGVQQTIAEIVRSSSTLGEAIGTMRTRTAETSALVQEVTQAMSEQRIGSTDLLKVLETLTSITTQVRTGASEMSAGNATLLSETTRLRTLAGEITEKIETMTTSASGITTNAKSVAEMAELVRGAIARMDDSIGKFRT